jgi:signal transduction histidine kinase
MKPLGRVRISLVEVILVLAVGVMAWVGTRTFNMMQEITRAPISLERVARDYADIASHVNDYVATSHEHLNRYATQPDAAAWREHEQLSRDFLTWLDTREKTVLGGKIVMSWPSGLTVDFGTLLADIRSAASDYMRAAKPLSDTHLTLAAAHTIEEQAETKGDMLLQLGADARAQANGIELFLGGSKRWFILLKRLTYATITTLAVTAFWLALVIFRRVVNPLRARLHAAQAMVGSQQKLAHFGELAAVVAHEIRNPLTAISTRLYTLQRSLPPGSRADGDATIIRDEITRLNKIVTDFLETARPREPVMAPLEAEGLFGQIKTLLGPAYERQHIEMDIECAPGLTFQGDQHQLEQVLINLVKNAMESVHDEGKLHLRAHRGTWRLNDRPTDVVLLAVEDNGPGIPADIQPRLFDPFFSTKQNGAGLGLSIALQIVNRHGGTIDVRSQPGRTVFTVVLPLHEAPS